MRIVVHNYLPGYRRRALDDGNWSESKHPRVSSGPNAGQFAKGAGGGGGDPHKIGPYFQNKYKPSENATHLTQQVASVAALKNQSTHYRNVVKMLLGDLEQYKHQLHPDLYKSTEEKLKGKIVESLAIQKSNLIKKGEVGKAAKIDAKMIKWGVIPQAPIPTTLPAKPEASKKEPSPAAVPYASPEDLEKAKSTAPAVFYDVPDEAKPVVKAFNDRYAGKQLINKTDLAFKVEAFGYVKKFIAEAKDAQLQKQAEALKAITSALHASPEQAKAFAGLAQMVGGGTSNADHLIKKFQEFEKEAKDYGYPISGFECALVKSYSDGTYGDVNAALRKGSWTEQEHAYNKVLNSALRKMPPFSGTVWRGASLGTEAQKAYVVGNIVEERAFTSTSTSSNHSQTTKGNTRYVITAKGRRGANIRKLSHHGSENEVLFQSRTFFKVTQVQGTPGGPMTVHMEEYWND